MKVGIIAMGSHEENHGPALPLNTDAKIAQHIAKKVSEETSVEFLDTLESSHEFLDIDHGNHQTIPEVKEELLGFLEKYDDLGYGAILIINAHGGNLKVENHLPDLEEKVGLDVEMDSTICEIEGPHAGSGEASIGAVIGITDEDRIDEQSNIDEYPEVGFAGFEHLREEYDWVEKHAKEIIENGVEIDEDKGENLLYTAISSGIEKVRVLKEGN